jgi:hypothetical protein
MNGTDPLAAADFRRDQLRDSFACRACGSPDPAIIRDGACSDCRCMLVAHIERCPGTPGRAEGHELLPGWIAFDEGGHRIEVEVS